MKCLSDETLSAVLDGEILLEEGEHVEGCRRCAERLQELRSLDDALRSLPLVGEPVPNSLRATLRGMGAQGPGRDRWIPKVAMGGIAAAMVLATLVLSPQTGTVPEAIAEQAISSHLRAFSTGDGSGCHVESQDPGALEHWLSGMVGSWVDIPLPFQDARLVGARRCELFGEATAAVVYRTEEAPVTVFFPSPGSTAYLACEKAMGSCTEGRDGQTVCIVPDQGGAPLVVVGALSADRLCGVVGS